MSKMEKNILQKIDAKDLLKKEIALSMGRVSSKSFKFKNADDDLRRWKENQQNLGKIREQTIELLKDLKNENEKLKNENKNVYKVEQNAGWYRHSLEKDYSFYLPEMDIRPGCIVKTWKVVSRAMYDTFEYGGLHNASALVICEMYCDWENPCLVCVENKHFVHAVSLNTEIFIKSHWNFEPKTESETPYYRLSCRDQDRKGNKQHTFTEQGGLFNSKENTLFYIDGAWAGFELFISGNNNQYSNVHSNWRKRKFWFMDEQKDISWCPEKRKGRKKKRPADTQNANRKKMITEYILEKTKSLVTESIDALEFYRGESYTMSGYKLNGFHRRVNTHENTYYSLEEHHILTLWKTLQAHLDEFINIFYLSCTASIRWALQNKLEIYNEFRVTAELQIDGILSEFFFGGGGKNLDGVVQCSGNQGKIFKLEGGLLFYNTMHDYSDALKKCKAMTTHLEKNEEMFTALSTVEMVANSDDPWGFKLNYDVEPWTVTEVQHGQAHKNGIEVGWTVMGVDGIQDAPKNIKKLKYMDKCRITFKNKKTYDGFLTSTKKEIQRSSFKIKSLIVLPWIAAIFAAIVFKLFLTFFKAS